MLNRVNASKLGLILLGLAVLLLAAFFNFYRLGQTPPGLNADEAAFANDALDMLAGNVTLYTQKEGGAGALWRFLLAPYFALVGPSVITLRSFAGIIGVAAALLSFLAILELALLPLAASTAPTARRTWSIIIAATAAVMLSVSYWFVSQARPAFPTVLMLAQQNLTFFLFWRAIRGGRRLWYVLAGVSLGLMAYAYLPGKLAPVVIAAFLGLDWLLNRRQNLLAANGRNIILMGGVTLLVAAPMLIFALLNWQMLAERAALPGTSVASFGPGGSGVSLLMAGKLLGLGLMQALGPLVTLFFVVGLGVSLFRLRQPAYLFLLLWWLIMMLPGALAMEGSAFHLRRSIGAVTPTFALAALGLASAVALLFWLARRQGIAPALPAGVTLALGLALAASTGLQTWQRYFVDWGHSEAARLEYHVYDLELAELMARESGPEAVYLLPLDSTAGIVNPLLDSITFVYHGQAGYNFLPDDEPLVPARLTEAAAGRQLVRLLTWNVTKHTGADPKNLADYYLEKWGEWQGRDSYHYYNIDTYRLPPEPVTFAPAELLPLDVAFEGQMALTGAAFGPENGAGQGEAVAAGGRVWAELNWQKLADQPADYQVSLWLEDVAGHPAGQADKQLWSNVGHQPTSRWPAGASERDYYLLPVDSTTAPGRYRLKAVLYDGASGRRLAPARPDVGADLAVTLGEMTVLPALQPLNPATLDIPQRLDVPPVDGLKLLGFAADLGESVRPGDRATLWLWWQVVKPAAALAVAVGLGNPQQAWPLAEPAALGSDNWPVGSVIRTPVTLRVPAAVESGGYNLGLRLLAAPGGGQRHEVLLGPVQVLARERRFDVPDIARPVSASFGDEMLLLGYSIDQSQAAATGAVKLALVWQAQAEMETPYKVFVHVVDAAGQIIAQVDREPQAGAAPTTGWLPGEVIVDEIEVPAAENLTRVTGINVGVYNPASGERLVVSAPFSTAGATQVTLGLNP